MDIHEDGTMIEFPFRAVLLDMDGTLVDSDAVVERVWRQWATRNRLEPDEVLTVVHGRQGHESMALLLPDRDTAVNLAENRAMLAAETADTEGVVSVPGAAALLDALDALGVPHALVTSADEALAATRMDAAGLRMPTTRVTAEWVLHSKPDPEGFLLGAELLGVAPADCIVFEDSAAGIAAARAAGTTVIGVGDRAAASSPDHVVGDLRGIHIASTPGGYVIRFD